MILVRVKEPGQTAVRKQCNLFITQFVNKNIMKNKFDEKNQGFSNAFFHKQIEATQDEIE